MRLSSPNVDTLGVNVTIYYDTRDSRFLYLDILP